MIKSERIPDRKIQNPVFAVKIPFGAGRPVRFTNRNSQIETNHQDTEINSQTRADPNGNLLIKLRTESEIPAWWNLAIGSIYFRHRRKMPSEQRKQS